MKSYIIGHQSDFTERRSRVVHIEGMEIAVFQLTGGEFQAIENLCPHKKGKLSEGIVCDHHVYCPLHDWKIDLHDGLVQAPDEGCVQHFDVHADEQGNVVLLMPQAGSIAS